MILKDSKDYKFINIKINVADNVGIKHWSYGIVDNSDNVVYGYGITNAKSLPKVSKTIEWDGKSLVGSPYV
ncbi:MAG: hypothetical protein N2712_04590 [Brevinematales bacterium]|nr:hypothetical protein [Brevinematales bacterium]